MEPRINFYSIFPKPDPIVEIGETRFVVHVDEERPGYNAWRPPEDIPLERQARNNWQGDIVSLQHVPVFPPGQSTCPYHYVNIEDIIKSLEESKTTLVSAHFTQYPPLCTTSHLHGGAACAKATSSDHCGYFKRKVKVEKST